MTLNAIIALILRFQADYITVVEDRPDWQTIIYGHYRSPSSTLLLLAKTVTHPAARSLCDSWASCFCNRWMNERLFGIKYVRLKHWPSNFVAMSMTDDGWVGGTLRAMGDSGYCRGIGRRLGILVHAQCTSRSSRQLSGKTFDAATQTVWSCFRSTSGRLDSRPSGKWKLVA